MKNINDLTEEKLRELYLNTDIARSTIADMYGVSRSKIDSLLKKYNIRLANKAVMNEFNKIATEHGVSVEKIISDLSIFNKFSIEEISRALAHYFFRNGPIEDMHKQYKIAQQDMKILNKYCYNKIFTFFTLIENNDNENLLDIVESQVRYGSNWNKPEFTL